MNRNSLADLAKISLQLTNILDDPLWELYDVKTKDFSTWFLEHSVDKQEKILNDIAYKISSWQTKIYNTLSIAEGLDYFADDESNS